MAYRILIADDEPDTLDLCSKVLRKEGYEVFTAKDGLEAISMLKGNPFDLLLLDIRMPGKSGIEVLDAATGIGIDTVMITAYATIETAVEAMKRGARDYLAKPFTPSDIRSVTEKVIAQQRLLRTEIHLCEAQGFCGLVGNSLPMRELYEMIEAIAATDSNVLIEGESGTGKELVARAIHAKSRRGKFAFIPINCGAIPETLLESELFGYAKGAFTGAVESKKGLFEAASNGTVFLDEIAETTLSLQVRLLRVLQDKEIRAVGSVEAKKVDVRIIAATNKELLKEVSRGSFREDLFYRLSVISLRLPPLRERKEDISLLTHFFINRYNKLYDRKISCLAPQAMDLLMGYHWPGNVRELEHIIERAVILERGNTITPKMLNMKLRGKGEGLILQEEETGLHKSLAELEREHIEMVLKATKGNRTRTARILGISRRTLYDKIIEYGIMATRYLGPEGAK